VEYRLASRFTSYRNTIALVGCGGTGGFVAEGLCRLGCPGRLLLIDGDRVEERNLGRQNFYPEDLGRFKSQALAERLARKYQRPIAYSTAPLEHTSLSGCALVVGCVDNAPARAAIARAVSPSLWWLDAGNGREFGQVLMGNAARDMLAGAFEGEERICHALPLPTLVRPELLVPAPREGSCAQVEQGPTINQFMAALVVEVVRRLLEGSLSWWQVYLDLEAGSLRTVWAAPEAVSRLTGLPVRKLVRKRERR
jgi:PRTRC genetic system ThiF family protein